MLERRVLDELSDSYPQVSYDRDDLPFSMSRFYQATGRQFVIVIDEWDAPMRERENDKGGQRVYLDTCVSFVLP